MSKFQEILKARRTPEKRTVSISDTQTTGDSDTRISENSTRKGRPPAKRSNPDFLQVTAYIRRQTHHQTKLKLLQEGQGREFSQLVEDLLSNWLAQTQTDKQSPNGPSTTHV